MDEISELRQRLEELARRTAGTGPAQSIVPADTERFDPTVEIHEANDKVVLLASLAGFRPDEIRIEVTPTTIEMEGERPALFADEGAVPQRKSWLSDAAYFAVGYDLPAEIDTNRVKAAFLNGILTVELAKTETPRPRGVKVPIEPSR